MAVEAAKAHASSALSVCNIIIFIFSSSVDRYGGLENVGYQGSPVDAARTGSGATFVQ
jgi:hypothetical protein